MGRRVSAAVDERPLFANEKMSWKRLLCFPDPLMEREFAKEFRDMRERGTLLIMVATGLFYIFNFVVSDGLSKVAAIAELHISTQVLYCGQLAASGLVTLLAASTWFFRLDTEAATMIYLLVVAVSLFAGNRFRLAHVFGGDLYETYIVNCDAAVCYDDTLLLVSLAGITSVTIIFAAIRVVRSWVLVILTTVFYFFFSSFGLGPMPEADMIKIGVTYVLLMSAIWLRSYTHERELRRQWVDNRRLRLEVEQQTQRSEEQRRWLDEVNERLDAMQMRNKPAPPQAQVLHPPDVSKYMVPGHGELVDPRASSPHECSAEPNAVLSFYMEGRRADAQLVRNMAARIRDADYGMREYFDDCLAAFPELELFHIVDQRVWRTSSGRDGHTEYQRTFGALFALYWLLRLDGDGRFGWSFGCDENWRIRTSAAGDDADWKTRFFEGMDWSLLQQVRDEALGDDQERIEAMLCLTAIHDIMKMSPLVPTVSPEHAPYHGYSGGDCIHDHDQALAYVLEHFPHLLPSFEWLPVHMRDMVLFTQTQMSFNHGWFVQAEGPPGAVLSPLRRVLRGATGTQLAFYFVHWLTDLSGAEGTPLAGAERFTRKFPLSVLICFLWSMPYLQRLAEHSETEVVQDYLEARFREHFPGEPLPHGESAIAALRLAVMAQRGAPTALEAFREAPPMIRRVLSEEMALTGVDGQTFRGSSSAGGPAFLVYYGPALLQRCTSLAEMNSAQNALARVYAAGRRLWPKDSGRSSDIVTLEVGQLLSGLDTADSQVWALTRQNDQEAKVELLDGTSINRLVRRRVVFVCMDLAKCAASTAEEAEEFACIVPALPR